MGHLRPPFSAALVAVALLSACGGGRHSVALTPPVSVLSAGTELLLPGASWEGKPVATVRETADEVRVTVEASTANGRKCADIVRIHLREPLGERALIDVKTGRPILTLSGRESPAPVRDV